MAVQMETARSKLLSNRWEPSETGWWEESGRKQAEAVWSIAHQVLVAQAGRQAFMARLRRMYDGGGEARAQPVLSAAWSGSGGAFPRRLAFNAIASCVDTLCSRVASEDIRVAFQTTGGTASQMKKAKRIERFVDGTFYEHRIDQERTRVFRSAAVLGNGATEIRYFDEEVRFMPMRTMGLLVDEQEAATQADHIPQLFYISFEDRHSVMAKYPKSKAAIKKARRATTSYAPLSIADQIVVVHAYRPSSKLDRNDGALVVCIQDEVLEVKEWARPYLPIAAFRYSPSVDGWFGVGLGERITGHQLEINRVTRCIQLSHHFVSVPRVFIENGSNVVLNEISNEIGSIVKFSGSKPLFDAAAAVSPELLNYLVMVTADAIKTAGTSEQSIAGTKTPGIDSAVGLRTQVNIETDRFKEKGKGLEQWTICAADLALDATRDAAEDKHPVTVQVPGVRFVEEISWDSVQAKKSEYVIQAWPVSLLPKTPEGRLSFVSDLLQAQMISPEMGRKLMNMPDLEAFFSLANAAVDDVEAAIERMLDGNYERPEPYQELSMAESTVQSAYLRGRAAGQTDEELDPLLRYLSDVDDMQQEAAAAMAPPPAGPGAPPPANAGAGAPMPPPKSPMLPNAPKVAA
jgi:hypothetical protein